jgi:preprotein translocase subunit SecD
VSSEPPSHHRQRSKGPLIGSIVVLAVVVAVVVAMIVRDGDKPEPEPESGVVEFRRVTAVLPDACSTEGPKSATPSATPSYCGKDGHGYQLGPVELDRTNVAEAAAVRDGQTIAWLVRLTLDGEGKVKFAMLTSDLAGKPPGENRLAIVVDGRVVSAPEVPNAVTGGEVDISGNFTESQARQMVTEITG